MHGLSRWSVVATLGLTACGGGGGGGSGDYDGSGTLLAIEFADPEELNLEPLDTPPQDAPLLQQIVLRFSARPDPNRIHSTSIQVQDESGFPVAGRYTVDGEQVTFTPQLPTRPIATTSSGALDTGGTGLLPNHAYGLRVGALTSSFIAGVDPQLRARFPDAVDSRGIFVKFRTTADPARFFGGLVARRPLLVAADPRDGSVAVSPNLYSDPDGLFAPPRPFELTFDGPLDPGSANLSDTTFQLVDLDDHTSGFASGLPLRIGVRLIENALDRAVVEVTPSGLLPFGHLLALEQVADLRGLSEGGTPAAELQIATTFTTAVAPATTIHDELIERFDDSARHETDPAALDPGALPADWNRDGSHVLQAALEFRGDGVLGPFEPPPPAPGTSRVLYLDTARQVFPLPDGSTPGALPGAEVVGGVFPFTDIDIPDGVVIRVLGSNPLVLSATGSVRIAGDILIGGENGTSENSYDSAITSLSGGAGSAGGGRGGESHPIYFFPPETVSYLTLVSPPYGGTGYGVDPADGVMKRIGGTGGQCGCLDAKDSKGKYGTDQEIDCTEFRMGNAGEKTPGGGGGSLLKQGATPKNSATGTLLSGVGNVIPDGTGHFIARTDTTLLPGVGGQHPFFDDGTTANDFFGKRGQLQRLIGGQGGGSGASLTESYYCGVWCDHDDDTTNDNVCQGDDFGDPPIRGDSVGDARGGAGGGGGGALLIEALGSITITQTGTLDASGGSGGGGEGISCSYWGGGAGGGAGGAIVLQSATSILVSNGARLDVTAGLGDDASDDNEPFSCGNGMAHGDAGDGGAGGAGLIQLQVPAGSIATVVNANNTLKPVSSWLDSSNTLNPVEFTPESVAVSTWYDLGRVTARAPADTNPLYSILGLDASGFVATDASGSLLDPDGDVACGYLGQVDPITNIYRHGEEPRDDFIPPNATVRVEFQGGDAIAPGSQEIDPTSITAWSPNPAVANRKPFLRWRVSFDLTADGSALAPDTRRPVVNQLKVRAEF